MDQSCIKFFLSKVNMLTNTIGLLSFTKKIRSILLRLPFLSLLDDKIFICGQLFILFFFTLLFKRDIFR